MFFSWLAQSFVFLGRWPERWGAIFISPLEGCSSSSPLSILCSLWKKATMRSPHLWGWGRKGLILTVIKNHYCWQTFESLSDWYSCIWQAHLTGNLRDVCFAANILVGRWLALFLRVGPFLRVGFLSLWPAARLWVWKFNLPLVPLLCCISDPTCTWARSEEWFSHLEQASGFLCWLVKTPIPGLSP